jgi:hypothetical protein
VGTAVGSGFPPQATMITAKRSRVPKRNKLFFIDIDEILLSIGVRVRAFLFLARRHLLHQY